METLINWLKATGNDYMRARCVAQYSHYIAMGWSHTRAFLAIVRSIESAHYNPNSVGAH